MVNKNKVESYISDNVLDMSLLQLSEFPLKNKTGLSKNVTTLNFSNNMLVSVPSLLCSFIHIREIDLSKNKLKALPDQFGELVNLRRLDLYDNQLSFLPLSFHKLQKLKWLDISSNPIPQALMSIAGPCQNARECENAAQKVVRYFGLLNSQVSEEFEKAKKAEKEKIESDEQLMVPKAKKQKNKTVDRKNFAKEEDEKKSISQETAAANVTVGGKQTSRVSIWSYIFLYVFVFILLLITYILWASDINLQNIAPCLRSGDCSELFLHYFKTFQ